MGPELSHSIFAGFFFFEADSDNSWVIGIASPKVLGVYSISFSKMEPVRGSLHRTLALTFRTGPGLAGERAVALA